MKKRIASLFLCLVLVALAGCSNNTKTSEYVPIIKSNDDKSISLDEPNNITSADEGIEYFGSKDVGYVRLAKSWREVAIPKTTEIPIVKDATKYMAFEDTDNKYLVILANYGDATGNQEELTNWIKEEPMLGSSSHYYPSGTIKELLDDDYGFIGKNTLFNNKAPVGYEFFATVYRDDVETPKFGLDDNNNILRGTIFEYNKTRYGLMYMRYNDTWDVDFEALCKVWIAEKATEKDIINQIKNSPAMQE